MSRRRSALADPPTASGELSRLPRRNLREGTELVSVVRKGRGPWWFGNGGGGRFDLEAPQGTCYLALDLEGAVLEVLGPSRSGAVVSETFFQEREIRRLALPSKRSVANVTSDRAAGFGITLELSTTLDYDLTRAWARAWLRCGLEGVLYWLRHSPAGGPGSRCSRGQASERAGGEVAGRRSRRRTSSDSSGA